MTRPFVLLAALAVLALSAAVVPARADTDAEIERTKAKIEALLDDIDEANAEIARLQAEANALAAEINTVLAKIAETQDEIARLRRDIQAATREMAALQRLLDKRARVAYESGPGTTIEMLLGATSLHDFATRVEYMNAAAATDRELLDAIANHRSELQAKQVELVEAERELRAQRVKLEAQQNQLEAKLAATAERAEELKSSRAEAERLLEKLKKKKAAEEEAARLAALAAERARRAEAARQATLVSAPSVGVGGGGGGGPPPSGGGGNGPFYVCPVDPPRAYSNDFGAPRSGGRTHQGNDIFAPYGTPIRAPFPGNAVESTNSIGGLAVTVYGSGGYAYNAHLSSIGQLGSVGTGDVIGYVGDSGNAQGTSPHDHFEWHPGNGGAVNPYYELNEVC